MAKVNVPGRSRGNNFTNEEKQYLIDLAVSYKHILENKKTDSVTWKDKVKAWDKIAGKFNAVVGGDGPARSAKSLRSKYECTKKEIRKKHAFHKREMMTTGGGPYTPITKDDPSEEKLKAVIAMSVVGLDSNFDNDCDPGPSSVVCVSPPSMKSSAVENENNSCYVVEIMPGDGGDDDDDETDGAAQTELGELPKNKVQEHKWITAINRQKQSSPPTITAHTQNMQTVTVQEQEILASPTTSKGKYLGDAQLAYRRRRNTKKVQSSGSMTMKKFEDLAEHKTSLVELQKEVLQQTLIHQKEKHEMEIALLKIKLAVEERKLASLH
ncbi:uncharacterized protein LOC134540137 [Bacillus rossius redtenbacheri]|uniref:uncharacterized protein LOC134540137 n=1 Tax=Bacillus rossius redtenbacheri TaxID=93214 RepID=UPI002FDD1A4B